MNIDFRLIFGAVVLCLAAALVLAIIGLVVVVIKDVRNDGKLSRTVSNEKDRRIMVTVVGLLMSGYAAYSILEGRGVNIIAALLGTFGVACLLYGRGRDGMLRTIASIFTRRK